MRLLLLLLALCACAQLRAQIAAIDSLPAIDSSLLSADFAAIQVDGEETRRNFLDVFENGGLYASKKSDKIDLKEVQGNLSANNPRAIYAKVAGLTIWENDNSGLQLNIATRGLNPNRSASINARQNGYDISADALGYPELYYTPPAQAIESIELVRGAAGLQYGSQFGGMLNFVLKSGENAKRPFQISTENTVGSFRFFNHFTDIGGKTGKFNYYGFYQYRTGDGWRANSQFAAHTGYLRLAYSGEKTRYSVEQTAMDYVAQQAGGLTDAEFSQTPRLSKRARNWFRVGWRVSAIQVRHRFNDNLLLQSRLFYLNAERSSLGNLQPINRPDYGDWRDLIKGQYHNWGNETRLAYFYKTPKFLPESSQRAILLAGVRLYTGDTRQQQAWGNADSTGSRADFALPQSGDESNPLVLRQDYRFPSQNFAAFVENYLPLGEKWSITPGIRAEYIATFADGYYQRLVVAPSASGFDTLVNEAVPDVQSRRRAVVLAGCGMSFRPDESTELYGNISQNYRAINFNDLRIANPNQVVDSLLRDERGYNADFGVRGQKGAFGYDLSAFYLFYGARIGNIQMRRPDPENPDITQLYMLRTNVGDARVWGTECLLQVDWLRLGKKNSLCSANSEQAQLRHFVNFSYLSGRYLRSANTAAAGKQLEFVSPFTLRTGLQFRYKGLDIAAQYAYTGAHFSDATNAEFAPTATVGRIPAYSIVDASASYTWRFLRLQVGCNNALNAMYFTRRAVSYPGPGILPADGRSFFVALKLSW